MGCDAAYGTDHAFLDGLALLEGVWYFAATNAKEQVFAEYPQMTFPETKRGRPRKHLRCFSCRADGTRSYVKPGGEIWLYLRKYADGEIKYFTSNAPSDLPAQELDRAATLRWPIEQCFEECKSNLGMGHYECRSYQDCKRHMLFVMIAHLFTIKIREMLKKSSINNANGGKTDAWGHNICSNKYEGNSMLLHTQEPLCISVPPKNKTFKSSL